jgi:hypothetical protein
MSSCSSIRRDLDRFYKSIDNSDFNIRKVTKSAFSQARKKTKPFNFIRQGLSQQGFIFLVVGKKLTEQMQSL